MNSTEINKLVDNASVDAWKANFASLTAAKADADTRLADAVKAAQEAHKASERALAGIGALSVEDAESGIESAERALKIAAKVASAADAKFNHERQRQHVVSGMAHKGVYEAGIKARLEACRAGDAAKAALLAAEKAYADATAMMQFAVQNHCSDVFGTLNRPTALATETQERTHWTAQRIDPDAPKHIWQPE